MSFQAGKISSQARPDLLIGPVSLLILQDLQIIYGHEIVELLIPSRKHATVERIGAFPELGNFLALSKELTHVLQSLKEHYMSMYEQKYSDLFNHEDKGDTHEEMLHILSDLEAAYQAPQLPTAITQPFHATQRLQQRQPGKRAEIRKLTRPVRRRSVLVLLAAAALGILVLTAAAVMPLIEQSIQSALQWQSDLPDSAYKNLQLTQQSDGVSVTLEKGYADANRILLIYTYSIPKRYGNVRAEVQGTITTAQGQTLPEGMASVVETMARSSDGQIKWAGVLSFDTRSIQDTPSALHLHLVLKKFFIDVPENVKIQSEHIRVSHFANFSKALSYNFTLPFHPGRNVQIAQPQVTVQGKTVTLRSVVVTRSQTTFEFQGIADAQVVLHTPASTITDRYAETSGHRPDNEHNDVCAACSMLFISQNDLSTQTGLWTITLNKDNREWTFKVKVH
ncbi:DUF4179 domain-containing protein [Ktedonosporobacter rubrisoli]|uniref:DUF4179 domain-containing protein n=1 Tax=Ktedonosporobacter rubrisoli TaxID=2509675 RepID=A0A4P6JW25_KTERU|nr:DUF4179 domain-containing protein [Ktedonosporobacter rubrisoli]QBD79877.1 DUF4179 domain-containing protein [Ktedonosporobacter rubrisoli]